MIASPSRNGPWLATVRANTSMGSRESRESPESGLDATNWIHEYT